VIKSVLPTIQLKLDLTYEVLESELDTEYNPPRPSDDEDADA
jgi:hypothetical protein